MFKTSGGKYIAPAHIEQMIKGSRFVNQVVLIGNGRKFASANAGLLYTAKGTASLLVPLSGVIAVASGWQTVFVIGAAMNVAAAIMALVLLKPMCVRMGKAAAVAAVG